MMFAGYLQKAGRWLGVKKPRLTIRVNREQTWWTMIAKKEAGGSPACESEISLSVEFDHDDEAAVILTDAYPEGQATDGKFEKIYVLPGDISRRQLRMRSLVQP